MINCRLPTPPISLLLLIRFRQKRSQNINSEIQRGANRIWTGDNGVADRGLTTWLSRHIIKLSSPFWMTPTGIEPVLPPWKGDVLTAWPRSLILFLFLIWKNSPSRARTYNNSVNSRVLYHWAIEDHLRFLCKCTCISGVAATERLCLEVTYNTSYKNKGLYLQNRYRTISIFFPS